MSSARCSMLLLWLLLVLVTWSQGDCEMSPAVDVTGGTIVGTVELSAGGRPYYAYRAVPFAESPEGNNRFQPPKLVQPWDETRLALHPGPYCAQAGRGYKQGEEDCLHLSVYTPLKPEEDQSPTLPVLVWLPGGGFVVSGAADYDPRLLMDKDLVLVVPQYRLGIFGFLYAMDAAPGNFGMLDQVAALRWVQDNIAQFGGDPARVTLGGDSSGGASALYHMVSPLSQGLFHGVLSVSGSALNPWAEQMVARQTRTIFALRMGCPRYSSTAMVRCFKELDLETMLTAHSQVMTSKTGPDLMFVGNNNQAPIVQYSVYGEPEEQFILENPVLAFGQGRFAEVPVLMMTARDEGNYLMDMLVHDWALEAIEKDDNFKDDIMTTIAEKIGVNFKSQLVMDVLWDTYWPGLKGAPYQDKVPGLARILTDSLYNGGIMHTARYLNDKVPTYLMRFDFEDGPHYQQFNRTKEPALPHGAGHLDQLNYFLPPSYEPFSSSEQRRVSELTLDIVDNFVNGRPPAADWPTITDGELECATITREGQLGQDRFLSPDRVQSASMMFQHHHRSPLGLLKRLLTNPARDEL